MVRTAQILTARILALVPAGALGQSPEPAPPHVPLRKTIGRAKPVIVPSLIILNSEGASLTKHTLALSGVARNAIVFADRPVRSAGHALTHHLLEEWEDGDHSFGRDRPNAKVSTFSKDGEAIRDAVVVLRSPKLEGDRLTFAVDILGRESRRRRWSGLRLHRRHRVASNTSVLCRYGSPHGPSRRLVCGCGRGGRLCCVTTVRAAGLRPLPVSTLLLRRRIPFLLEIRRLRAPRLSPALTAAMPPFRRSRHRFRRVEAFQAALFPRYVGPRLLLEIDHRQSRGGKFFLQSGQCRLSAPCDQPPGEIL